MDSLLAHDQNLFLFLNGLGNPFFDDFWLLMTHKATNAVVYLTFALIYGYRFGVKAAFRFVVVAVVVIACTDQLTNVAKYTVQRLRPCHDPNLQPLVRLVKAGCGGLYTYFSGHASNSFALATFFYGAIRPLFNQYRWVFFLLASLVAYSRVYVGVHYPLDILSGAVFGCLMGYSFFRLSSRFHLLVEWR
ncbi:MAG: phosphatase PAP2 family protein [Flavobacteriaceae bacterium]